MTWIATARRDLASHLQAHLPGVQVYDHWHERPQPPCLLTAADSPYLNTEEVTFGAYRLRWMLRAVAPVGPNQDVIDAIDDLLAKVLAAAVDLDVTVTEIDAPAMYTIAGAQHVAADIHLTDTYRPEEG